MHLLAVTATNDRSEVEIYRTLAERGHRVHLICDPQWHARQSQLPAGESAVARLNETGVTVSTMAVKHRLDISAARALRRIISTESPDVIYAPKNSTLSVALLATSGDTCPVIGYRGTSGHLHRYDPASWLTYFHPRLKAIVCVSEAVRRYLISKKIPPLMLHTIHKGHRVEWYQFKSRPTLDEFGIPPDAFTIGFTGNIRPVKGVEYLLKALPEIDAGLNGHALLAGEVRDKKISELAKAPAIAERAHFAGYRPDAPALTGACNAFIMPSVEREGLPRAVIEAMAQGVPPIVANTGGMPELVTDGICGIVVPPRNSQAITEALTRLAGNPELCRRLGQAAVERIRNEFNIDRTIDKIEKLFQQVAAN